MGPAHYPEQDQSAAPNARLVRQIERLQAELGPLREMQKQLREVMGYDASISVTMTFVKYWKMKADPTV